MKELLQRIAELLSLIYKILTTKDELQPIPLEDEVWLDGYDVMRKLNVSATTLYRRRVAGDFIAKKIGKKWFYLKSSVS